ncbi:hypothetical protein LT679_11470 [Mucilaginibacter roseus]|uniref:Uncharacterized protein n=1 Tax=Mucilaginibacter roseus TaxID=1528868 RepID=A0ABS8U5T3_9SPHI|nr:hypothetical protein [Mucilaginibacter roseus]MCD8741224.1 hypothetical protein [Mucilaginibacter roseus]
MNFIRIIQETVTWIEKVNPDFEVNLYRSQELSPKSYYHQIPDYLKGNVLNDLISKRSKLLQTARVELIPIPDLGDYGRIMFFEANETVLDGAPEDVSAFFIDIGDAPPWDTWLAIGSQLNAINFHRAGHELNSDLLIAWVPKAQYYYAQQACEVALLDNFAWPANEFISDEFNAVNSLFQKPDNIIQPEERIDFENILKQSKIIMSEIEENSKSYYEKLLSENSKKPFWKRMFKR